MKVFEFIVSKMIKAPVPAWRSFSTAKHTVTQIIDYDEISVPDNAVEVILRSSIKFIYGESAIAVGNEVYEVHLQITDMDKIFVKGTAVDQVIERTWGLL